MQVSQITSVFIKMRMCRKLHLWKILAKRLISSKLSKDSTNTQCIARQFQLSADRVMAQSLLILQHKVVYADATDSSSKAYIETVAVLQPQGSLSGSNVIWFLHQFNVAVMCKKHSSVVINLNQVDSIDSEGLMAIVNALKLAQRANKRFCLCSVPRSVGIVLELTRLDSVLEIFDSLSAFNSADQVVA